MNKAVGVWVLWIFFAGVIVSDAEACQSYGWFGAACQYKCQCTGNRCDQHGTCTDGVTCKRGWFGPACQYADLAYSRQPFEITDGDDSTCLNAGSSDAVTIILDNSYPFTWLRVIFSKSTVGFQLALEVTFRSDSSLACNNLRTATVDGKTLDIYCEVKEVVQSVTLRGDDVKNLCSVYISGGRNVALKQTTYQSTDYYEKNIKYSSNKAVDGNPSGNFSGENSCTHTLPNRYQPYWGLTFSNPVLVNRYVLYNRNDENNVRLKGFTLSCYATVRSNTAKFNYKDKSSQAKDKYVVISVDLTSPVSEIVIRPSASNDILTLCEVEVYGDSSCKVGFYGRECTDTCNCVANEPCFVSTGGCPSGCADGFYGESCNQPCDVGTYGQNCQHLCSQFCAPTSDRSTSSCDRINGSCVYGCQTGYEGDKCTIKLENSPSQGEDMTVVVGAVVGAVLVLVLLLVVVVILWRRHRGVGSRRGSVLVMNDVDAADVKFMGSAVPEVGLKTPPTDKKSRIRASISRSCDKPTMISHSCDPAGVYYNSVTSQVSTAISLDNLASFMKSKSRSFFQDQFNAIPDNQSARMAVGTNTENKNKNRYKNIAAYDHSRVHLRPQEGKKLGDYINASYVEGYKSDEKFIAAQGPTKNILEDFVRMLWEQEVEKVVMLTNLVEDGKQKCERYWPEDDSITIGEITVRLTTTEVFADYTIRRLQLKKSGHPTQNMTHFHFTSWPDKDIPTAPWGLVDFEQRVALYPTEKPIVVHCSAGVGRTGTFIALRNVMREAEETGQMDFFTTVQKLRHDRINMVQTVDQYIFLHRAAQVAMLCIGTTVTLKDMETRLKTLETSLTSGHTKMEHEFQSICLVCDEKEEVTPTDENVYENNQRMSNKRRNRKDSVTAKDLYRAVLSCEEESFTDYINAVLVPSFSKQNQEIITQLPLPETIIDFWRLVVQYKVTVVVAFEVDLKTSDETVGDYLPPSPDQSVTISMLQIRTEPASTKTHWIQQNLVVMADTRNVRQLPHVKEKEHHVTHMTCTTTDLDPGNLLAITQNVRTLRSAGGGRTLYMCRDGATYSGLVCVLSLLLDRMDNDHQLTVPLVVGAIKAIRPQVIPSLNHYRALYQVLQLYSESMNEYSNIGE